MFAAGLQLFCVCLFLKGISCQPPECFGFDECECTYTSVECQFLKNLFIPKFLSSSQVYENFEIEGNRGITKLEGSVFQALKIKSLDIHGTGIFHLPCDSFKGLADSLDDLSLTNNLISNVSACAFHGLQELYALDLSYNAITTLTAESFPELPKLCHLILRNNHISFIEDMALAINPGLEELDLRYNSLTSSVWSALNSISHFEDLYTVFLDGNPLEIVPNDFLLILPAVNDLTLRNCSLTYFPWEALSPTRGFYQLDLSSNLLKAFGTVASPVTLGYEGGIFNISFNKLETLSINFNWTVKVLEPLQILATDNELTTVMFSLSPYEHERHSDVEVDLKHNNINSTVSIVIQTDVDISMNFSVSMDRNKIDEVNVFPFVIKLIEFDEEWYWDPCVTSKSSLVDITVSKLSLQGNAIVSIDPRACLGVARNIDLSTNNLTRLDHLSTFSGPQLATLNVSHNRIEAVCVKTLPKTLRVLDLSDNLIKELPDFSDTMARKRFRSLLLARNPINCDCSILWTRLSASNGKLKDAICQTPTDKLGEHVLSVDLSKCNSENNPMIIGYGCLQNDLLTDIQEESGLGLVIGLASTSCIFLLLSIALGTTLCFIRYRHGCIDCFVSRNVLNKRKYETPLSNFDEPSYDGINPNLERPSIRSGYMIPISGTDPYHNHAQEAVYENPN